MIREAQQAALYGLTRLAQRSKLRSTVGNGRLHIAVILRHSADLAEPSTQRRMPTAIELPITLAYARGAYSVEARLGSRGQPAQLLLDTGSSTLAVLPRAYAAADDAALQPTELGQQVSYGAGAWAGPVLRTALDFGSGRHARRIDDAQVALIQSAQQAFYDADGIFGLAYAGLDTAHDCTALLAEKGVDPALTWPWPFATADDAGFADFAHALRQQPAVALTPCFSALEEEGVLRDLFALQVGRAVVHVAHAEATPAQRAADPLNRGLLVLGGGEHCGQLYRGPLHSVRIVHDLYYNARLIALETCGRRIVAPPLKPEDEARSASNAIFDTGSSFLVLQGDVYDAMLDAFAARDPRLSDLVTEAQAALASGGGLANARIDPRDWPDLHFVLEGADGGEVRLSCPGAHYWPHNANVAGQTICLLMRQIAGWPDQSILGLPLLAGRYCVFDRRARGAGVLRLAEAVPPP